MHVCICGDCEYEPFADRCKYEQELAQARERADASIEHGLEVFRREFAGTRCVTIEEAVREALGATVARLLP